MHPTRWVAAGLLIAATVLAAAGTWRTYVEIEPTRWLALHADRNVHYDLALELAVSVEHTDAGRFFDALDDARQWPPLHGLLAATSMLVTGEHSAPVAVWPNLLAFALTALLAFDLARRLSPSVPLATGLFAWATVLASPAHQAFATDLMLESLGAALSLLALDTWLAWHQGGDRRAMHWLAVALGALLFEKYNYYVLVVAGLVAAEWARSRRDLRNAIVTSVAVTKRQVRDALPRLSGARRAGLAGLGVVAAIALGLAAWTVTAGGTSFDVAGQRVSMRTPSGPLLIAWIALLGTLGLGWQPIGRAVLEAMPPPARTLLVWHGLPVALFGLLPGRLRHFADYVSPSNTPQAASPALETLSHYAGWASDHYAVHSGALAVVVLFATLAVVLRRRDPLVRGVSAFVAVGALLVALHPHHQSRFLHAWIPGLWVLAGVGLGAAAALAPTRAARPLALAVSIGWLAVHGPHAAQSGRSQGAEWQAHDRSTRALTDEIVAWHDDARPTVYVTRLPIQAVLGWAIKESPRPAGERPIIAPAAIATPDALERWLATWPDPRIVVVDLEPDAPIYPDPIFARSAGPDVVARAPGLHAVHERSFAAHGARIVIYEAEPRPPSERR